MLISLKKALAFALSLIMVFGIAPAFAVSAVEESTDYAMPSVLPEDNVLRAAFTASEITLNGLTTEEGWSLITPVGADAFIGAQWDLENLYFAVRNPKKEAVTVTLNGVTLSKDNSESKSSANKQNTEFIVSLKTLGVTVKDFTTKISTKVKIGSTTWEGKTHLTSIDWFSADNATRRASDYSISKSGMRLVHEYSSPNSDQGINTMTGGYNFYDRYNKDASRPAIAIRTSITMSGEKYAPFGDRTADTIVEFDFLAESMPVYKLGTDNDFFGEYSNCGFVWYMTDASDHYINMAIVNTDAGLVFVLNNTANLDNGPVYSCVLNKKLGEQFRIGTSWTKDGDVILYVDGKILDVIENAESTHIRMTADNVFSMSIARSEEIADSSEDDFNINVTNLAMGKYYGEKLIDSLGFYTIQGDAHFNTDPYTITKKLTLPTTFAHAQLGKTLNLAWESSDPAVIDPATGNVTQPVTNGKLVTLTATDKATGDTKSFDVYVKGLAPESDVLAVIDDRTTYKGKGTVQDVHEFTFDTTNNSIIRDLKEPTTVNVIALKDSDDINKLSETMLTIWVSDDNKTYEQLPSFKLLRDGQYTYLYDFEATARYIKVHCTNFSTNDCDFIGPLDEMIEAYYEDVFGDGGDKFAKTSTVTLTNDSDTAKFDFIAEISPADAGVKCAAENNADVRFYLDGEMLYHYFDGTNFYVRVTKIPKNSSVTLDVLSGNASAKDISNKVNVYEIVYGTLETDTHGIARYTTTLPNGRIINFAGQQEYDTPFLFSFSDDQGRSWSGWLTAAGSTGYVCIPQGAIYDEIANRLIVTGYHRIRQNNENIGLMTNYMYSDDMGRSWHLAPLTQLGDYQSTYLLSYSQIIKTHASYDGEDGPGVDFLHILNCEDPEMTNYYNNRHGHAVARVAYTTDGGKTWTLGPDGIGYYDGEAQGEHAHTREHGVCESHILEAKDGTIVAYNRCQYDNVYTLCRSFSYDHGKTWVKEAELSDVYSVNTQPYLFDFSDYQFMMWGGHNMFGQGSFRRYPLAIAVSYDNLMTFEGIHDLFSKTAFQGMITSTRLDNTNTQITKAGDAILLTNASSDRSANTLRVDDFLNYFFKTRGAYDTFEQTPAEWEGWATTGGEIATSDAQASDGKYSMRISTSSSAVRSIPYLQNGVLSFDLFIEDVDKAKFEFELESAYGFQYGLAAPIAFRLEGNKATFLGAKTASTLDLKDGWNHFEFNLDLQNETPAATLSVNDTSAINVPVNAEIGNYVVYVHVSALGELTYYLDEFLVNDMDNAFVPDVLFTANTAELLEVPKDFEHLYDDASEMADAFRTFVLDGASELYLAENTALYDLTPTVSKDGGDTWADASVYDIPTKGMTVKIAYPDGTSAQKFTFRALTAAADDDEAIAKVLKVTEKADGLYVTVKDNSPVILAWAEDPDAPAVIPPIMEDSSFMVWVGIGAAILVIIVSGIVIAKKSKKKEA